MQISKPWRSKTPHHVAEPSVAVHVHKREDEFEVGGAGSVHALAAQVLQLQKQLALARTQKAKMHLAESVASAFESINSFDTMRILLDRIDAASKGVSNLHRLVGDHLFVGDNPSCVHRVVRHINALARHAKVPNEVMIYSDFDDTLVPTLNDRASAIMGCYPGMLKLFEKLSGQTESPRLTILSARPSVLRSLWVRKMRKIMAGDLEFVALFGKNADFLLGLRFYLLKYLLTAAKPVQRFAPRLYQLLQKRVDSSERQAFVPFAMRKLTHINFDLMLRPHVRGVFFGDDAEGDMLAMVMKNYWSDKVELPADFEWVHDPRIPPEFRGPDGEKDHGGYCNPPHKPLERAFVHKVAGQKRGASVVRPDSELLEELQQGNIFPLDNAIDCIRLLRGQGVLSEQDASEVVQEVVQWLKKDQGAKAYRDQLQASLDRYCADFASSDAVG